jgi:hypothetical protein
LAAQSRPHKTVRQKQQQSITKGKELTDYQKGQIEGRSESKSHSDINKDKHSPPDNIQLPNPLSTAPLAST